MLENNSGLFQGDQLQELSWIWGYKEIKEWRGNSCWERANKKSFEYINDEILLPKTSCFLQVLITWGASCII